MSNSESSVRRPQQAIEEAYVSCLDARSTWTHQQNRNFPNYSREDLHALLHSTVFDWYEALVPYLRNRDKVEEHWNDVELWPLDYQYVDVLYCPACNAVEELDGTLEDGDGCPNCGQASLARRSTGALDDQIVNSRVHLDEDGEPQFTYLRGLKNLDDYRSRTKTVTRTRGTFMPRRVTETKAVRLRPEILLKVARLLDEAADELGLIATAEDSLPEGGIIADE